MPRRRVSKKAVLERVAHWRSRLLLDDWALGVIVDAMPPEDDATAANAAEPEYRRATLYFDPYQIPAKELDDYVVHELLHCLTEPLAQLATVAAGDDPMRKEAVRMAEEELVTRLERVCRSLATEADIKPS